MQNPVFQSDQRYRIAFGLTFITGMTICTFGIANTSEYGWLNPSSIAGILLGLTAFVLGGSVLARRTIGPIASEKAALFSLLGIIAIKFILAGLYPVFR